MSEMSGCRMSGCYDQSHIYILYKVRTPIVFIVTKIGEWRGGSGPERGCFLGYEPGEPVDKPVEKIQKK